MTFDPQCKTRADLHREWARVLDMCEDAGVNDPSDCVRFMDKVALPDPSFNARPTIYEFAIAIVEGKPVFRGDVLQAMGIPVTVRQSIGGRLILADGTRIDADALSWDPPKPKTITINGVEVKAPDHVSYLPIDDAYRLIVLCSTGPDALSMKAAFEGNK